MHHQTFDPLHAEIAYRQERITRDFQRPLWFRHRPATPVTRKPGVPAVRAARHAM